MKEQQNILAEKLGRLFDEVRKPDGSKYTQAEVVEGTKGILTRVYLWKLRTGRATNPGYQIIKALADFFGVDIDYFSERDENVQIAQPEGRYLKEIQARAYQVDEKGRKAILDMMDYILSIQKSGDAGADERTTENPDEK